VAARATIRLAPFANYYEQALTQEDLAHAARITTGTLSTIEGGRANPSWATVRRIGDALGVAASELAAWAESLER
jgi:DNA-binding XRE family transcriptional regulator